MPANPKLEALEPMDRATFVATMKRMSLQGNKANLARLRDINPTWFNEEIERIKKLTEERKEEKRAFSIKPEALYKEPSKSEKRRQEYLKKVMEKRAKGLNR